MASEYWNRFWKERASRRRFLGVAGVTGAGAAGLALVGCGGSSSSKTPTAGLATNTAAANATATPNDPFAGATKGGNFRTVQQVDPPTIDPYGNASFLTKGFSAFSYSRLFKYNAGPGVKVADLKPVPDIAESYTASADALTWTIKLRQGAKFHNIAPVNGRQVDSDDVKYSWGRATDAKNTNASQLKFVDSVAYPDAQTVVFTLKSPNAAFLDVLSDANLLWIMPKEAAGGFDPTTKMIGSGPWIFDSYTPSQSIKWKKNPDWYMSGFPLFDTCETDIIPAYANQLAQFQAGSLDAFGPNADDLVSLKSQVKDVQLLGVISQLMSFFYFDADPNSPWTKDNRVRQAVSMSLDRDGLTDLGYEVKKLQAAGLDVQGPWNNIIPAGMVKFWDDPQGPNAGAGGKNFKYNVADAKAALSAAGYPDGFEAKFQYPASVYGPIFESIAQASIQFLQAIGIKVTTETQDYASKYITQTFAGNFSGIAFGYETPFPEGGSYPTRFFTDNPLNHGHIKDPKLADLAVAQQKELDPQKRKDLFTQIQQVHAEQMWYVPNQAGAGTGWTAFQPNIQNATTIRTVPGSYPIGTETYPFFWRKA
jgi:peptide/nickel transport system substrate-binding protein